MPTHAAFLRAVNLGGRRRVVSDELRTALVEAGFEEVATFRASGNAVLGARGSESRVAAAIEAALRRRFGFPVEIYLRSAGELRSLIAGAASLERRHGAHSARMLQVAFLRASPGAPERDQVRAYQTKDDVLDFAERELLWLRLGGTGRSELHLRAIEKLIGPWTMRTLDTIEQIYSRYFD